MEFSFRDILQTVRKNIVIIVAVSLVFSVVSFLWTTFFVDKTYTATVKLYVSANNEGVSGYDNLQSHNYAEQLVGTYIQMLDTNNFFSAVSEELGGDYSAAQLNAMTTFTSVKDTEVFKADIICTDPYETKRIADAVAHTAPKTIKSLLINNAELKIVDEATVPTSPTSPNVPRNVIVAFVSGLLLSLIIAFVHEYFDIKIKYDEDMTTLCDLPVLSAVPDFEYFTNNRKKQTKSE